MTVYIDILFMTNFFANSVIFFVASVISAKKVYPLRIFAASALSALYGCLMFFSPLKLVYGAFLKLCFGALFVLITFGKSSYLKSLLSFWIAAISFGGAVMTLSLLGDSSTTVKTLAESGVFYINVSPIIAPAGSIILYLLMELYKRMNIKNFSARRITLNLALTVLGTEYALTCLIDTGCELTDPLSGSPALIAEKSVFKDVAVTDGEIFVQTAAGGSLMPFFFPDDIYCKNKDLRISPHTPVVLSDRALCRDGRYNSLINPNALYSNNKIERSETLV